MSSARVNELERFSKSALAENKRHTDETRPPEMLAQNEPAQQQRTNRNENGIMAFPTAPEVVREFWRLMATNDFHSVGAVLAPEFILEWPQSKERIRGAESFARMNEEYPAHGFWRFTVNHIVGANAEAVSDVAVTDGVQTARAISFFVVSEGKISRIVEFWPASYPAPTNRAHLVELLE